MLQGICTPVCSPFTGTNNSFDENAYISHVDRMLESGVDIIAVAGGTGEFAFLTKEEKNRMTEIVAKRVEGKAKFLVHTSAIRTEDAIENAKHAEDHGADALMILPPFFEGPQDDGVFLHYEQIAKAVKTPIMLYNIPVHSGYDITPEMFKRLAQIPNVQYIKDSTGCLKRSEDLIAAGAKLFCGCDYLTPYALLAGATGCFWGASNITPKESVQLYALHKEGKLKEMFELWDKLKATNICLWNVSSYNSAIKAALSLSGHDMGYCRLPVQPLNEEEMAELKEAMKPLL